MPIRALLDASQPRRSVWLDASVGPPPTSLASSGHAAALLQPDPPFRVLGLNQAWTSLCGFQPSELIGRPLQLGKAGGVSAAVRLAERALEAHGSYSSTVISQSKSGRPFLQHLQARKVTEEGRTYVIAESYGESSSLAHAPLPGFLAKLLRHESASERMLREKKARRTVGVPAHRRLSAHGFYHPATAR